MFLSPTELTLNTLVKMSLCVVKISTSIWLLAILGHL